MLARIALDGINVHLGDRHVLRDISWQLGPAEHWAIAGPNGSGKSTLLRVIAGTQWIDSDGGERIYSPDGSRTDVVARATTWIRSVSAEQHERIVRLDLPLDGRAVIESGIDDSVYVHRTPAPSDAARVERLIEHFDLAAIAARPIRELSSGQLRRLLIARALVTEPRVLILDEFTNGLDRSARRDVLAFLDRIATDVALVVASHRVDDFPAAITHTATLRDGQIESSASGRTVAERPVRRHARPDCADLTNTPVVLRVRGADVYRGRSLVLENVNWDLRSGEHTTIRGANGAGKTTFARLIAGTIVPAIGAEIIRFGERGPFDIWRLKERIAYVCDDLQIAYTFSDTVAAVVASGFPASIGLFSEPTTAQWKIVSDVLGRFGLESLQDRPFTQLSFGERRKVLIARSLVRRPAIFVLDEVWNGLDAAFRIELGLLLDELARDGTTIVTIGHDENDDFVDRTRRVCVIENRTIREVTSS